MRTMEILSSIAVAIDKVINLSGVLNDVTVVYYAGGMYHKFNVTVLR